MAARNCNPDQSDQEWFQRTEHCGRCGNPGDYCTCTEAKPCGCRSLHAMGSARSDDALSAFMAPAPVVDQPSMFGEL